MDVGNFCVIRFPADHILKPFDCGDEEVNRFLLEDSRDYLNECLAVTYLVEDDKNTIAYFSVQNDKIAIEDFSSKSQFYKARKKISQKKLYNSYPAVKIGRLGVSRLYSGQGYGKASLDYLKLFFLTNNRTGCRFLLVDAYNDRISFYEANGFVLMKPIEKASKTQLMYCDLITFKK